MARLKFTTYFAGLSGHLVTLWATQDHPAGREFDTSGLTPKGRVGRIRPRKEFENLSRCSVFE